MADIRWADLDLTDRLATDAIDMMRALLGAERNGMLTHAETLHYMGEAFDSYSRRVKVALRIAQ